MMRGDGQGTDARRVLASPDDLDLRMVWADALQQKGDPRGELAALQLAKIKTYEGWVREAELIERRFPGDELVEDDAERVDIDGRGHRLIEHLLRCHVRRARRRLGETTRPPTSRRTCSRACLRLRARSG
jgi:uncharacterized protein (TIGR02996 family)